MAKYKEELQYIPKTVANIIALERERDELKAELKEWPLVRDSFMSKIEELASQNTALLQRVQELEKRLETIDRSVNLVSKMTDFKF